ncbi:hypothetical protein [Nocardia panacis]|uniref:hypothetical protein n=1 Tax=Nocardia panacis TaxID=2340916 RepID=UPI0011C3E10F|nr:hypothetical protein [Nocardia panacis]
MHQNDHTEAYMAKDRKSMTEFACEFLDRWLAEMGSALERWRRSYLPADFPFDFTLDSLDALEPIVLARYPDRAALDAEDDAEFTTGTVRYIGEVLLRVAPSRWGYWDLGESAVGLFNRIVVIRSNTPVRFQQVMVPEHLLKDLLHNREHGFLRKPAFLMVEAAEKAALAELPATGVTVPDWCAFFTADEYLRFAGEVDAALRCFGADGQDIDFGCVSLAAGDPDPEMLDFDIDGLAVQCRASDMEDWPSLCFTMIEGFFTAQPQRDWLTGVAFTEVEDLLEPWLADKPELLFVAEPDDPDQPFSIRLEGGSYLHFLAAVPDLEGIPEVTTFVPNSAVRAWDIPVEKLVRWGIQHIRAE